MTPHNEAKIDDISNIVLMPGDPLRAKYIADTFLDDAKLVNTVRNMFGYTGFYKGKKLQFLHLEWVCQALEFILMSCTNFIM